MHTDIESQYRNLLKDDPPSFLDRVNTPWDDVPDVPEYNQHAFNRIERALRGLTKTQPGRTGSNTQGILVLGEAGTGKTHLLMRVAQKLSESNHILFIRKPNNEDAVAQHIWTSVVNSLERSLSTTAGDKSQLDDLLTHVFSKLLVSEFEQDIRDNKEVEDRQRWIARLQDDPFSLFTLLGEGERRQEKMAQIRRRILRLLQITCPDVDQTIARVLITYCFVRREDRKRVLLNWLKGTDVDVMEAEDLGLPTSWVTIDEKSSDISTQQQREEQALRAIRTIGILSTYYQPLILAFDQLEGLRGKNRMTDNWGDTVREIFTMTPNLLVLTCIWPSLWDDWLNQTLDQSVVERIAQQTVNLESFAPQHGLQMLATHWKASWEKHRLPTSIYPFTDADVASLCQKATSPRSFLQGARAAFESWLDGDSTANLARMNDGAPQVVTQQDIDRTLREAFSNTEIRQRCSYEAEMQTEQDLVGRICNLTETMLGPFGDSVELSKATHGHYVMPPNIVVGSLPTGKAVCMAIMNSEGSSFFPRIRNLNACAEQGDQFTSLVLLRDRRCRRLGPRSQELLDEAVERGAVLVEAGVDEITCLNAAYEMLVAVEEHDLCVGNHVIDMRQFVEFVKSERVLSRTNFYRHAGKFSEPLASAIGLIGSSEAKPTMPIGAASPGVVLETRDRLPAQPAPRTFQDVPATQVPTADVIIGDNSFDTPHAGILGELRDDHRRLAISLTKPQGLVILGYMGSGKSYALGVLIENALMTQPGLISQTRPMSVVAFNYRKNPHSRFEYGGFAVPNNRPEELATLAERYGASPAAVDRVNVFGYEAELSRRSGEYGGLYKYPIQFRPEELGAEHWEILMKPPNKEAEYMDIIRDIIQKLHYQERLSFHNLERYIESDERLSAAQQKKAKNRLSFAQRWISDDRPYEWGDVLKEGTLNIFDLRMQATEPSEALRLCLIVTDLVRRTKNGVNKVVVFDEAHEYVDCKQLVGELENALTQIRHDGLSFVLASQFPERIPKAIFKYLLTRLIFKLPTTEAITYLRNAAPNLQGLVPKRIANLDLEQGVCFIQSDDDCTDSSLRTPQLIEIRPRCSLHGGATVRQLREPELGLGGAVGAELSDQSAGMAFESK